MPARDTAAEAAVVALARTAMERGLAALAAQDTAAARRWLDRAHRLVPGDPNAKLTLATACLAIDPARAASLFADVAENHDVRQAWLGLAAARLRDSGPAAAAEPLGALLSRHAFAADSAGIANQIGAGMGWCGLHPNGRLEIHPPRRGPAQVTLDGRSMHGMTLPAGWARGRIIAIQQGDTHLLGSPTRITSIRRLAGCVEVRDGGLRGWAWHPGDPDTAPVLTLTYTNGRQQTVIARDESGIVPHSGPLARPRVFGLAAGDLLDSPGPIHVTGPDGRQMLILLANSGDEGSHLTMHSSKC